MKVGDSVRAKSLLDGDVRPGTICYIHPRRYYLTVQFKHWRECFIAKEVKRYEMV